MKHPSQRFASAALIAARHWFKSVAKFQTDSRQQKRRRAFTAAFDKMREYDVSRRVRRTMARSMMQRVWRTA